MDKKFLLRSSTGDLAFAAEAELHDCLKNGQCRAADFLYEFAARKWTRLGDHPALAPFFATKPVGVPDRRVIYFLPPGGSPSAPLGPFSTKEIQARAHSQEICANTWVFVEGDKEWRQVRNVKILNDMLPPLPSDHPEVPAAPPAAPPAAVVFEAPSEPPTELPSPGSAAMELSLSAPVSAPPMFAPPMSAPPTGVPSAPPATPPSAPPAGPALAPPPFSLIPAPGKSASAPVNEPPSVDSGSVALPDPEPEPEQPSMPSITLDLGTSAGTEAPPAFSATDDEPMIEREESTLAIDVMGLNLHSDNFAPAPSAPPPKPAKPGSMPMPGGPPTAAPKAPPPSAVAGDFAIDLGAAAPPAAPPKAKPATPPGAPPPAAMVGKEDHFDGIVAEIPMDPIWLVKQANSEAVSGPFRFLEVIKFLEEGKLSKNDKIARTGNKAFAKIAQQYEFNVKFSIESVIENGQEKQKILIRRRHPRVPYITGVQVVSKHGLQAGQCINISAGGILMEVPKAEFNLGEIIEVKILPGLINKSISSKSLIIGKIPKIPPGYALKFEDLKPEDKEAIEYYVQETLKREMQNKK